MSKPTGEKAAAKCIVGSNGTETQRWSGRQKHGIDAGTCSVNHNRSLRLKNSGRSEQLDTKTRWEALSTH